LYFSVNPKATLDWKELSYENIFRVEGRERCY